MVLCLQEYISVNVVQRKCYSSMLIIYAVDIHVCSMHHSRVSKRVYAIGGRDNITQSAVRSRRDKLASR